MLNIYLLNANKGDSIVLHYIGESGSSFAVIDSYNVGTTPPPALAKLKELGADSLSFVALTHPHADHYIGLPELVESYQGKIHNFYSFPLDHLKENRLKNFASIYETIVNSTDDFKIKKDATEFVRLLVFVKKYIGLDKWEEVTGYYNRLYPVGFNGVEIYSLLPPPKVKGDFFRMIDEGTYQPQSDDVNKLSLAFCVKYKGHEIILGGDGTKENWESHKRTLGRSSESLSGKVVKLPHHGSKKDCTASVISYLTGDHEEKYACISASGGKHPHLNVLKELQAQGIKPYCTNLSKACGAPTDEIQDHHDVDPVFNRYLNIMSSGRSSHFVQPCQGTITVSIDDCGILDIHREVNNLCAFRNEFDFL